MRGLFVTLKKTFFSSSSSSFIFSPPQSSVSVFKMSFSKFFLSGIFFFRLNSQYHTAQFLNAKYFPFKSLQFHHRYCSASAALSTLTSDCTETLNSPSEEHKQLHPWPEWVSFIDRLKTKGYFPSTTSAEDATSGNIYKDINQLKDPCLGFARDRYDLFKSLSASHIRDVVDCGCPNLIRKVVDSAKRLRAYLGLDEGEVCGACNIRESCDRAYLLVKDNDEKSRTMDIVRLLLFYALDPLILSREQKPPGREVVEAAVRKLLSDLTKLSETKFDPPKKRGDWMCPKCNFMNHFKSIRCLKCSEEGQTVLKKGDWICSKCEFMNFWRNIRCLKCEAGGPRSFSVNEVQMKKGDWNCPKCQFMNFSRNMRCLKCKKEGPKRVEFLD